MMQHLDQHPHYELLAMELLKRREYYSHKSKFEAQDCSGPLDKAHAYDKYLRRLCALARVGEHDKILLEFGGEKPSVEEDKQELSDSFPNGLGDGLATVDEDTPLELGSDGVNQNVKNEASADMKEANSEEEEEEEDDGEEQRQRMKILL